MRKLRSLLIVLPSMALGSLLTATLTTTAHADPHTVAHWNYKVVDSASAMTILAEDGWEYCGESAMAYGSPAGTMTSRTYTMRKKG